MDWTRRQFGLWSSAALLVGPRALAGEGEKVAAAPRDGLDALELMGRLDDNEPTRLRYTLTASSRAEKGLSFRYELTSAALVLGEAVHELPALGGDGPLVYLEQRHPFARRLVTPDFVDVAPGASVALEALMVEVATPRRAADVLQVTFALHQGLGDHHRSVVLSLPWPGAPST